jgi:hypothetical protein
LNAATVGAAALRINRPTPSEALPIVRSQTKRTNQSPVAPDYVVFESVRIVRDDDLVVLCEIRGRPVWIARRHVLNQALPPKGGLGRVAIPRWLATSSDPAA